MLFLAGERDSVYCFGGLETAVSRHSIGSHGIFHLEQNVMIFYTGIVGFSLGIWGIIKNPFPHKLPFLSYADIAVAILPKYGFYTELQSRIFGIRRISGVCIDCKSAY